MTMETIQAGDLVAEAEEQVPFVATCEATWKRGRTGGDMMNKYAMIL